MTPREVLLAVYHHQRPSRMVSPFNCTRIVTMPGDRYFGLEREGYDAWGVRWTNLGPNPGLDGSTPTPGYQRLTDITRWQEQVEIPDVDALFSSAMAQQRLQGVEREKEVVQGLLLSGTFERVNQMLGFENALCAFYEEPEAMHDLLHTIADYKLRCIDKMVELVDPDVIIMHDDWGMSTNMLFSPEIWREFIRPLEKRYAERIHSYGKLYEHHSCGYITPIVGDLVEIGVDALNPLNVCNDLDRLCAEYGGKLALLGGLDNQLIDRAGTTEAEIRAEVRRAMDAYGPCGSYLPYYIATNGARKEIVADETERYGAQLASA